MIMKQVTTSKGTFLFVELPEGIAHTIVTYYGAMPAFEFYVIKTHGIRHVELPKGWHYNLICTTANSVTIEHLDMVFDYSLNESLIKTMENNGLKPNTNYAILKICQEEKG